MDSLHSATLWGGAESLKRVGSMSVALPTCERLRFVERRRFVALDSKHEHDQYKHDALANVPSRKPLTRLRVVLVGAHKVALSR
jgi:hypothetical protein